MGLPVNSPNELPGFVGVQTIRDISTTPQTVSIPSGAKWVKVFYWLLPNATAVTNQLVKFVVNAATASEAAGKLNLDGANYPIVQGREFELSAASDSLITRIDAVAEQAVGAEKTVLVFVYGV